MLQFVLFFLILLQNKATVSAPCEPCIPCRLVSIASVMLVCIVTRRIKWMDGWILLGLQNNFLGILHYFAFLGGNKG